MVFTPETRVCDLKQWNLLKNVSPVFGSDLGWSPKTEKCDSASFTESASFIRTGINEIQVHVPSDHVFSESTYHRFIRDTNLLFCELEKLVLDVVRDEAAAIAWESDPPASETDLENNYPKLVALSKLMESCAHTEMATEYDRFINLRQSSETLKVIRYAVHHFNEDMLAFLSKPTPPRTGHTTTDTPISEPPSRFNRSFCDRSKRLFDSLATNFQDCPRRHRPAMLHLKDFGILEGEKEKHQLELSMLLSPCSGRRLRQETHFHVPPLSDGSASNGHDSSIDSICNRLKTLDLGEQIFAIQLREKGFSDISASMLDKKPIHHGEAPSISLLELLERGTLEGRYKFPQNDRRILVYTLVQALCAFYEGPWLHKLLTSGNIFFFHRGATEEVVNIHHPYVPCDVSQKSPPVATMGLQGKYSSTFALAKTIMELESGKKVNGKLSALRDLYQELRTKHLDRTYAEALHACLFFQKYVKDGVTDHDVFIEHICRPLERCVDISTRSEWGRQNLHLNSQVTPSDRPCTMDQYPYAVDSLRPGYASHEPKIDPGLKVSSTNGSSKALLVRKSTNDHSRPSKKARRNHSLFDVQNLPGVNATPKIWKTEVEKFEAFRDQILPTRIDPDTQPKLRVRVTVIDTGIDGSHPLLTKNRWASDDKNTEHLAPLFCDFVVGQDLASRHNPIDKDGHGTFIAGILLQMAPDIELSIARVCETRQSMSEDTKIGEKIRDAIRHAIKTWKTEIISMSFGLKETSSAIRDAIEEARRGNVILLAAAGNSGNYEVIPYPAREDGVFKVFAANEHGKKAEFNPPTIVQTESFHTLGCGVVSAWPSSLLKKLIRTNSKILCRTEGHRQYSESTCGNKCDIRTIMSGTSFATPYAAALVALIYQFYNVNEKHKSKVLLTSENEKMFKTHKAVRSILEKMSVKDGGDKILQPWRGTDEYFHYDSSTARGRTSVTVFSDKLTEILRSAL